MDAATKAMADELNQIRLEEDRSYASLAAEIGIDQGALHRLLNNEDRDPWDRTVYKIHKFLTARRAAKHPAKRRTA